MTIENIVARMNRNLDELEDRAQETISALVGRLTRDPFEALRQSSDAFAAAADVRVVRTFRSWYAKTLDEMEVLDGSTDLVRCLRKLSKDVLDRVVTGARYPTRSTSACANLIESEETRAWVEVYEEVDSTLSLIDNFSSRK